MTKQWHPEELALLSAIHANPREDSVRLVYADWLQEHDDPMAEFVRWQVRTKRNVSAFADKKGVRLAFIDSGPPQWCRGKVSDTSTDDPRSWLERAIASGAKRWLRPFPHEATYSSPQVTFQCGLPTVSWENSYVRDTQAMTVIHHKLLPHLRLEGLIFPLHQLTVPVQPMLDHPLMGKLQHISISVGIEQKLLIDFLDRFAATSLPDRIPWLMFLSRYPRTNSAEALASDSAVVQHARNLLGSRIYVNDP